MNRALKFRAWVNKGVSPFMASVTDLDLENGEVYVEGSMAFTLGEEADLMQFTGLFDRNGKEIYEGDILRMHCGCDDGAFNKAEIPGEVVWAEDRFTVRLPDRKYIPVQGSEKGKEVSAREMHGWVGMHTCLLQWTSKLEVTGNIYENPDLLKI